MIRPIIKEQLEKCQFADLNNFDPATNTFYIKKYSKPTYEVNHCYLVKLPLTKRTPGPSTLPNDSSE